MGRVDQTAVCLMGPVLILVRSSFSLSLSVFFSPPYFLLLLSPRLVLNRIYDFGKLFFCVGFFSDVFIIYEVYLTFEVFKRDPALNSNDHF